MFWPDFKFPPINLYSMPKQEKKMTIQDKLIEMLTMQDALNQMLHAKWKDQPWDMSQAIIAECGELLDELGFKWWKHHQPNYDNVRLELVDIWHFVLNTHLVDRTENEMVLDLQDAIEHSHTFGDFDDKEACVKLREWLAIGLAESTWRTDLFLALCLNYGVTFNELYWLYMIKNTLNMFRWNNGYREGNYQKDWNGKEDNQVLMEIYEANKELPFKELYKKLEWHYQNKVAPRIILPQ